MHKVVIVEDEKRVRQEIVMETDWTGINCIVMGEAADGGEGIGIIRKCRPDIVITDIRMPILTGIEMIRKVQEEGLDPKVIFLTACDDFPHARQALRLGAADYLLKPFSKGQIEAAVSDVIEKQKRKAQRQEQSLAELKLDRGDKSKYIMDAIGYVEENYANPNISVKDVSGSLGISEGHLSFLFRKETDSTLMVYVTRCRMRAAMNLLKNYRNKVYEVAAQTGYHDITYFSRTFKKYVGVSPSEYQNRYSPE